MSINEDYRSIQENDLSRKVNWFMIRNKFEYLLECVIEY